MNRLILTDVDDTILRFSEPFQDWVIARGLKPNGNLREQYSIEKWLGVPRTEAVSLIEEFSRSPEMVNQPPEECALEVLPRLYAEGWRFVAITACGIDEEFRQQRWQTLNDTFGFPWEEVHTVGLRMPKTDVLKGYEPAVWVEDNFQHAVDGAAMGHRSFILHRAYNADDEHPEVIRVPSWRELHECLKLL